jgi:hypothetical protein
MSSLGMSLTKVVEEADEADEAEEAEEAEALVAITAASCSKLVFACTKRRSANDPYSSPGNGEHSDDEVQPLATSTQLSPDVLPAVTMV